MLIVWLIKAFSVEFSLGNAAIRQDRDFQLWSKLKFKDSPGRSTSRTATSGFQVGDGEFFIMIIHSEYFSMMNRLPWNSKTNLLINIHSKH